MLKLLKNIDNRATDDALLGLIREVKEHFPHNVDVGAALARIIASSGTQIARRGEISADVASTGGPSSLSTLICPLFLRAAGATVPKLGVPGRPAGGVDCLLQIPGYRALMTRTEIESCLDQSGYVHFLGGEEIASLDSRMFRLRQQSSAQDVPTLVAASLIAKKLAVGINHAGLDIRVAPHGNFGKTWDAARHNARLFIEVGDRFEIQAAPVLTDGRYPYQPYIGRKEALLALSKIFSGQPSKWLTEHYDLCRTLAFSCIPSGMRPQLSNTSSSDLQQVFYNNATAQGGDIDGLKQMLQDVERAHRHVLSATRDGFAYFDLQAIRGVLVNWQNSSVNKDQPFPDPVGIVLTKRPGEWVREGEIIATVRIEVIPEEAVLNELKNHIISVRSVPLSMNAEGVER